MKELLCHGGVIIAIILAFAWPSEGIAQGSYQITSIKAFLYHHQSATFGKQDYIAEPQDLWNTIIGESSAGEPSSSILVFVDISGPGFSARTRGSVELRASTPKHTLLRQSIPLKTFLSESRNVVVPFLIYGTGCEKLHLIATVVIDTNRKHSKAADVDFHCGE